MPLKHFKHNRCLFMQLRPKHKCFSTTWTETAERFVKKCRFKLTEIMIWVNPRSAGRMWMSIKAKSLKGCQNRSCHYLWQSWVKLIPCHVGRIKVTVVFLSACVVHVHIRIRIIVWWQNPGESTFLISLHTAHSLPIQHVA